MLEKLSLSDHRYDLLSRGFREPIVFVFLIGELEICKNVGYMFFVSIDELTDLVYSIFTTFLTKKVGTGKEDL